MEAIIPWISTNGWIIAAAIWPYVLPNPLVHKIGYYIGKAFKGLLGQRKVWTWFRGSIYALISGIEAGMEEK